MAARPSPVIAAVVAQSLITGYACVLWIIWTLAWGHFPRSLWIASVMFLPAVILSAVASLWLRRGSRRSWFFALVVNALIGLAALCYVNIELGLLALAVDGVLLWVDPVRQVYLKSAAAQRDPSHA